MVNLAEKIQRLRCCSDSIDLLELENNHLAEEGSGIAAPTRRNISRAYHL